MPQWSFKARLILFPKLSRMKECKDWNDWLLHCFFCANFLKHRPGIALASCTRSSRIFPSKMRWTQPVEWKNSPDSVHDPPKQRPFPDGAPLARHLTQWLRVVWQKKGLPGVGGRAAQKWRCYQQEHCANANCSFRKKAAPEGRSSPAHEARKIAHTKKPPVSA